MSALSDLQAAITAAQAELGTLQADVQDFVTTNSGGATDVQLQALTTQVQGITEAAQAIDAIVKPPAPPAPAPVPAV